MLLLSSADFSKIKFFSVPETIFEKVNFEKEVSRWQQIMKNYPVGNELKTCKVLGVS